MAYTRMTGVIGRTERRRSLRAGVLTMAAVLAVGDAYALGLGKLRVKSALDEPLLAEIELTSVDAGALESLKAQLAPREQFELADVAKPDFLDAMQFEIVEDAGKPFIKITTAEPTREPFLHFLVTVEWAGGELVREYTALLDPPTYSLDIPASVSSPKVVEAPEAMQPESEAATPSSSTQPEPPSTVVEEASGPQAGGVRSGEYGPTQKGDTLWSIASKLDVGNTDVNVFQVMIALLRENPNAFVDFNINRLKVGQILKLDDIALIAQTSKREASLVYQTHLDEWQAYKVQIAEASQALQVPAGASEDAAADAAAGSTDAASAAAAGDQQPAVAAADEPSATAESTGEAAAGDADVLRIVRAAVDREQESGTQAPRAAAEAETAAMSEQIQSLEEALTSRELENKELRDRVSMLERQVEKANRLIELQSEQLAQMQEQAATQEQQATAEVAPQTQAAAVEEPPAEAKPAAETVEQAAKVGPAAETVEQVAKVEPAITEPVKTEVAPPSAKPGTETAAKAAAAAPAKPKAAQPPTKPAAKPAAKKAPAVKPQPQESMPWWQGILDSLFSSWQYLVGLIVAGVALVVGLIQLIRRRRSIAEFEESILTGSVLDGQTETTDTTRATSVTDTSFLSDFGMAGMGTVQADEVDPLAESEVYLAYGRDEQAEEVLKEAIKKDASRHELKLKLLEIYQQRHDLKSFETLAEELYPAGGQGDPVIWKQVVAMGRTMNPQNPLFAQDFPDVEDTDEAESGAEKSKREETPAAGAAVGAASAAAAGAAGFAAEPVEDGGLQPFPVPDAGINLDSQLDKLRDHQDVAGAQPELGEAVTNEEQLEPTMEMPQEEPFAESSSESSFTSEETEVRDDESEAASPQDKIEDVEFDLDLDAIENEADQLGELEATEGEHESVDFDLSPAPTTDEIPEQIIEEQPAEPRVAQVTPLSANKPRDTDLDTPSSDDLGPAKFVTSAELESWSGDDGAVGTGGHGPDAQIDSANPDLKELAATVSSMDDEETKGDGEEQWDEAATKLDLARAYIDMGDNDGARSIIDEVLKEGSPVQKNQAQELANQIGA